MKFLKSIAIIICSVFLVSVFFSSDKQEQSLSTTDSVASIQSKRPAKKCEQGTTISGVYYVKGSDIDFRVGPGSDQAHVVNRKATDILGETLYRTLSSSMVLEGLCESDEWLNVKIVKADGSTVNWETGWVHKKHLTDEASDNMKAGLIWDIDGETEFSATEKKVIKLGALKVLNDGTNCAEIFTGYRSSSRKGAYYVTCNAKNGGPPFNVWFTPDEVKSNRNLTVPPPYPAAQSRKACEQAIQASVTHPSTLDLHQLTGYATEVHNNGNRTVIQEFSARIGLGVELQHQAKCLIQPNGDLEIVITSL